MAVSVGQPVQLTAVQLYKFLRKLLSMMASRITCFDLHRQTIDITR